MDGSRRLAWLGKLYAATFTAAADRPSPAVIHNGIHLDHVSFAYPGTSRLVLEDISLTFPAGSHRDRRRKRAGKTTLVKLVAKMYEPSSGPSWWTKCRLPHAGRRVALRGWRSVFRIFFRFEIRARQTVGLGDVPHLDDEPALWPVGRAGADDVGRAPDVWPRHAARPTWRAA